MPARTANLFLLEDLENLGRTSDLPPGDLDALRTAIYNSAFRPFRSPVPFLFVRNGVVGDWKFFLDDEDWLGLWARRFGESDARALAEELRHLRWRVAREAPGGDLGRSGATADLAGPS